VPPSRVWGSESRRCRWRQVSGPGWQHVRVTVSLVYKVVRKLLSIPRVLLHSEATKDAELLVLRHENAVAASPDERPDPVRAPLTGSGWLRCRPTQFPRRSLHSHLSVGWVSATAILTSRGIILIDALNTPDEAEQILVPGLRELGADPSALRYVVVTHAHGDHFGGAQYLADQYGARVMVGAAD
jgi:hypothetical protein